MIKIRAILDDDYAQFIVSGHSGYAEPGHDIVCAGVSVLTNALMNIGSLLQKDGYSRAALCQVEGDIEHVYLTIDSPQIRSVIDAFAGQYEQLAEQYPEYIRFEVIP